MITIRDYIVLFLVWLTSTILIRTLIKKRFSPRLPPSPLALPIIGHLHLLAPIPHQALAKLASKHGPLIHIRLGSVPFLVASSPKIAKEVLKTNEVSFSDRPQTLAIDYLTYGSKDFSFAPYGPYWKFMKKLCMSQLLGGQTLDILEPIRRDEVNTFLRFMYEKAKVGSSVDVGSELIRMTNNVISRMLMSERCSGDGNEGGELVRKLVQEIAEVSGKFNLSDYIWFCKNLDLQGFGKRLKEVRNRFDEMMKRIIDEHESERRNKGKLKGGIANDLLHILLDISEDEKSEMKLTRENIKAFILVKFMPFFFLYNFVIYNLQKGRSAIYLVSFLINIFLYYFNISNNPQSKINK
ncbi:hypothetical protein ACJIZ3_005794 [Penstemon smallii]|uniref:Uncharacterized protein n=1 Tax=Penstemon smallii TaxID=265156 RepID=A0ABD3S5W2_9LAMI